MTKKFMNLGKNRGSEKISRIWKKNFMKIKKSSQNWKIINNMKKNHKI